ncbi:MAG: hypothetical protein M2R45_02485 [Verrucomicrobia subdivision 3 bacterium]|nr:hypothetical protein [Limisphaerales bacterium]MCS1413274.1 hypothetical protein [Limisphaerales bacterium]
MALELTDNRLTSSPLPEDVTHLKRLGLWNNRLTSLTLPKDLVHLEVLLLGGNPIEGLRVPTGADLSNLQIGVFSKDEVTYYDPADGD